MNPALTDATPAQTASAWREGPTKVTARLLSKSMPWWLWPHLLSLDAPLVALVWQRWWAHAAGVVLPPSREIVLGLGVWLIYLLDRVADSKSDDPHQHRTARHVFAGHRRNLLQPLAILIASVLIFGAPLWLTVTEFGAGLVLLALVCGYYWLIHYWPGGEWAASLPKEAIVGMMFAVGSIFFTVCRSPHPPLAVWPSVVLFAVDCFLNCAFITKWERHARDLRERFSLLNSFPRLVNRLGLACAVVAASALVVAGGTGNVVAVPVAVSACLLATLDRHAGRMSPEALRVAADMVLLTPWIGLAFLSASV